MTIQLAPGTVPDAGTLTSSGSPTNPDATPVTVDVTNAGTGGTGTFVYTAPAVKPVGGSGTLSFSSTVVTLTVFNPASIAVSDS